ncbi:MAG: AsmA family protein [Magnetospiraceae bacterium]
MKKFLIGSFALLMVAVAALLSAPLVIDWSVYRGDIERIVSLSLGREVSIQGSVNARLLPYPAMEVGAVTVESLEGGAAPYFARIDRVSFEASWMAFFRGELRLTSVTLGGARVQLERRTDGVGNWILTGALPAFGESFPIRVDQFQIQSGTLRWIDSAGAVAAQLEAVAGRFTADAVNGPFQGRGQGEYRGVPLSLELSIGRIDSDRPASFSARLGLSGGAGSVQVAGTLSGDDAGPTLRGQAILEATSLAKLMGAIEGGGTFPGALDQPFKLETAFFTARQEMELPQISLLLGSTRFDGGGVVSLSDEVAAQIFLAVKNLNLDSLAAAPPIRTKGAALVVDAAPPAGAVATVPRKPGASPLVALAHWLVTKPALSLTVDIRADALILGGDVVRQSHMNWTVGAGGITLNTATALLPGGTSATLQGVVAPFLDPPAFTGSGGIDIGTPRGFLRWLGIEVPAGISQSRLRTATLTAQIAATSAEIRLQKLAMRVDTTELRGALTLVPATRPSVGANLHLDHLDLDGYAGSDVAADILRSFAAFDANFKLSTDALYWGGRRFSAVGASGTLQNGTLTLSDLTGTDGDTQYRIAGAIQDLGDTPRAQDLSVVITAQELRTFLSQAGWSVGGALGPLAIHAVLNGALAAPKVEALVELLGGNMDLQGILRPVGDATGPSVTLVAHFPKASAFLQRLGWVHDPERLHGALDLTGSATIQASSITLANLEAKVAGGALKGQFDLRFSGLRPQARAKITGTGIRLDAFLPAPSDTETAPEDTDGAATWATIPVDFSILRRIEGRAAVAFENSRFRTHAVERLAFDASLNAGRLDIIGLTGVVDGGKLRLDGHLETATGADSYAVDLAYEKGSLAAIFPGSGDGELSMTFKATGTGASVRRAVASLAGNGNLRLTVRKLPPETPLPMMPGLAAILEWLGGSGAVTADLTATEGRLSADPVTVIGEAGRATLSYSLDPLTGTLTGSGTAVRGEDSRFKMSVRGNWEAPRVTFSP